jgi:hypothetical protein
MHSNALFNSCVVWKNAITHIHIHAHIRVTKRWKNLHMCHHINANNLHLTLAVKIKNLIFKTFHAFLYFHFIQFSQFSQFSITSMCARSAIRESLKVISYTRDRKISSFCLCVRSAHFMSSNPEIYLHTCSLCLCHDVLSCLARKFPLNFITFDHYYHQSQWLNSCLARKWNALFIVQPVKWKFISQWWCFHCAIIMIKTRGLIFLHLYFWVDEISK